MKKFCFYMVLILTLMPCVCALGEGDGWADAQPEPYDEQLAQFDALVVEQTAEWEKELGYFELWPLEKKVEFYQTYGSQPSNYAANTVPIGMPEASDMSAERAVQLSSALIKERYELSDAELNEFKLGLTFCPKGHYEQQVPAQEWSIRYYTPSPGDFWDYRAEFIAILSSATSDITIWRDPSKAKLMSWGMGDYAASMLLHLSTVFYAPEGGEYYHIDNSCSSISPQHYDQLIGFDCGLLPTSKYKHLKPCPICLKEPSPEDIPSNR